MKVTAALKPFTAVMSVVARRMAPFPGLSVEPEVEHRETGADGESACSERGAAGALETDPPAELDSPTVICCKGLSELRRSDDSVYGSVVRVIKKVGRPGF